MRQLIAFVKQHPAILGLLTGFGIHPVVVEAIRLLLTLA